MDIFTTFLCKRKKRPSNKNMMYCNFLRNPTSRVRTSVSCVVKRTEICCGVYYDLEKKILTANGSDT